MWLFYFHDSEHRKISNDLNRLKEYISECYDYTKWSFNSIDTDTVQVIDADNDEQGMIVKVSII